MKTIPTLTLILLTFVTAYVAPNSFAQNVEVIYFIPNDRTKQSDIDSTLDSLMKEAQQFYADVMESNGFGRKTFSLATDADGNAVVQHIIGEHNDTYYHNGTTSKVLDELDTSNSIYYVAVDISSDRLESPDGTICGIASGSIALTPASGECFNYRVIAHELGHIFGLSHDRYNNSGIDSMVDSFCAAEWLDVHPIFNSGSQNGSDNTPAIEMSPPSLAPSPDSIRFSFTVTDSDGLHQAQLYIPEYDSIIACKNLNNASNTTVEFITTYIQTEINSVYLKVIDVNGNFTGQTFSVDVREFLKPGEIVTMPDVNLAVAVRAYLDLTSSDMLTTNKMKRLTRLFPISDEPITDLTGIEHATNLVRLGLYKENAITDFSPLAKLTNLVYLELSYTGISDLSVLTELTNLETLHLYENAISDVSALAGLTKLERLELWENQISNISSLAGLTNLTYLDLNGNQISDISPLSGLTSLLTLRLSGNPITDRTPLETLKNQNPELQITIDAVPVVTNNPPVFIDGNSTVRVVPENAEAGTSIGSPVKATDPDTGDTLTYTLGGTDKDAFDIDSGSGQLKTKAGVELDFETKPSYTMTVTATDTGGLTDTIKVNINLQGIDEVADNNPPVFSDSSITLLVPENAEVGTNIGEPVTASDTDTGDVLTYTLDGTDKDAFDIDSGSGQLKTKAGVELDFETKPSYTMTVTATDTGGLTDTITVNINLQDIDEVVEVETISIPDENLASTIRGTLSLALEADITQPDMEQLESLSASNQEITDLTGIEYAINLQRLELNDNQISDISPLSGLTKLVELSLVDNQISDATPLVDLINLDRLVLVGNPIKNREPLLTLLRTNENIKIYLKNEREPLPVTLSYFRAEHTDAGVILKWITESEVDNAGFYIYRSETRKGEFKVVNPTMIQGTGTTGERNEYTWTDTTAKLNTVYYYRIKDVSHAGEREQLATVRLKGLVSASDKLNTSWAVLKGKR